MADYVDAATGAPPQSGNPHLLGAVNTKPCKTAAYARAAPWRCGKPGLDYLQLEHIEVPAGMIDV